MNIEDYGDSLKLGGNSPCRILAEIKIPNGNYC